MYKRAETIQGDADEGTSSDPVMNAGANGGVVFESVMSKWTERLETIYYFDSKNENISKQILYLNVISKFRLVLSVLGMMCRND